MIVDSGSGVVSIVTAPPPILAPAGNQKPSKSSSDVKPPVAAWGSSNTSNSISPPVKGNHVVDLGSAIRQAQIDYDRKVVQYESNVRTMKGTACCAAIFVVVTGIIGGISIGVREFRIPAIILTITTVCVGILGCYQKWQCTRELNAIKSLGKRNRTTSAARFENNLGPNVSPAIVDHNDRGLVTPPKEISPTKSPTDSTNPTDTKSPTN